MKIFGFLKTFLPRIETDNILEDLRVTSAELDNVVIPCYRQGSEHFKLNKLKSVRTKDLSQEFYRHLNAKGGKKSNMIEDTYIRIISMKENAEYIKTQIESLFDRDVIREGLTAKKASLIRAAEGISFISRYSTDLLNYFLVMERLELDSESENDLSPAAIKHVEVNVARFARLLSDFGMPLADLQKIILEIPDVVLNDKTASGLSGLYKETDLDPFAAGYAAGFTGNPIYHVRLLVAEWQASRYKANKEKKKLLELRLLQLRLQQEKKNDPKLEQEIEYLQSRVDKITRYLNDVETDLGV